ncbi:MAG: FGGY-family carbohydrate kinase [Planctomycetota bacterium]
MADALRCTPADRVVTGWDFSTGSVKCLAFDLSGHKLAEVRLPTDLYRGPIHGDRLLEPGTFELSLLQLEGQARATTRAIAGRLREQGRLKHWVAGGISATHHTAGRIDRDHAQVRRAICWNDSTLAEYHRQGLERLGGQEQVQKLIGGPWAVRYSLSHLVKDEEHLSADDWKRTFRMLPHGALASGFLTGNFNACSVSVAASTGLMDFKKKKWAKGMLNALANPEYRKLAWNNLPEIIDQYDALGPLAEHVALDAGIDSRKRPLIYPTSDDQQAGLVGGGAVDAGQLAIVLGNSAVVNSSSKATPSGGTLDVMRLNWGPYLWMRCYSNGAQFLDQVVGPKPDWKALEAAAEKLSPGAQGAAVWPFVQPEPSLGIGPDQAQLKWFGAEPREPGQRFRAALEGLAYLIALGVREHERAGQKIRRITVSGGIARSDLMCRILASVLQRPLSRLESDEGPALGAAVTALAAYETHLRREKGIAEDCEMSEAVACMVRFKDVVEPVREWIGPYQAELATFQQRLAAAVGARP